MSKGNKRSRDETKSPSKKFMTYSAMNSSHNNSTNEKEEEKNISPTRSRILSASISPLEKVIFETPIDLWGNIDRSTLQGWHCSISNPITIKQLSPIDISHNILRHIALYKGPVINLELDAIVNAANTKCLGGGGVDGAIHSAAGPLLLRECATFNGCKTGECRLTKGYQLPARYIIHTVGPIGEKPKQLQSCYRNILSLAHYNGLRSVGFCCVSTGVYGYPLMNATRIAVEETLRFLTENKDAFDICCFACFKDNEYEAYKTCIGEAVHNVSPKKDTDL